MDNQPQPQIQRQPRGTRDVRVDRDSHPGWLTALERLPAVGERVHTHEGTATVVAILGKTSDGGRLLELSIDDGRKHAFFAAAANVLVEPPVDPDSPLNPGLLL